MARIYKAHSINLDARNKVEIGPARAEPPADEIKPDNSAADIAAAIAAEASQQHARNQAKDVLSSAAKEASVTLAKAQEEAERIIREATLSTEQDRANVLLDAEKRGYAEGHEKGAAEAEALIAKANSIMNETNVARQEAIKALEPELVELIIRIVRKLISDSMQLKPQVVLHLIRQGLAQSSFTGDVTLRVSKHDYDHVVANKALLLESVEGGAELDVLKDFSLNSGDCVIETPFGVIDSSLDMQFEEIRESLRLILEGDAQADV